MDKLSEAIMLATEAHAGQFDKGGQPYILHPLRVMLACKTEDERIAAVLHDVVEDCGVPLHTIRQGFGLAVEAAVDALTRRPDETYAAFIDRCSGNETASRVKLADLGDNMDLTRLIREPSAKDLSRMQRYYDAWNKLKCIEMQGRPA